jgi:hypothetical protein
VVTGTLAAGTPSVPSSTVKTVTGHGARYCVTHYAPNERVTVRVESAAVAAAIHTNNRGAGCTSVPVSAPCGHGQVVVATGTGADGNPATSRATVVPRAGSGCAQGQAAAGSAGQAGSLSGGDAALLGVAGAIMVMLAVVGATVIRRRRRVEPPSEG